MASWFGSQSPAFSEPLSSPASPTQQNKPFLLNAKEIVIQLYGVAKNDQYLNPLGVGVIRGPNKSAEFIFSHTFPLDLFKKALDLEDVAVAALQARLGLDRTHLVGKHARSCTLSGNTAAFFGNSAMVPLDRSVDIGPAATRIAQLGLTLYLQMNAIGYARLTLDQTCKTCNPSVPIRTWTADYPIGWFCVSPPSYIYIPGGERVAWAWRPKSSPPHGLGWFTP